MFARFTEGARQVVALAQDEARTLKHNYIGTEHILVGLLREEEGIGARVLESLDITVERVRAHVVRIVGSGEEVTSGQIPFTPRATKVLELAVREAPRVGHTYVDTEHILLGLVTENEGVAMRILLDFDAEPDKIRNEVVRMLSGLDSRHNVAGTYARSRISEPAPARFAGEPMATPSDVELGWRGRAITLAALGAAVLARVTFDPSKAGHLGPLEMQVLARLAVGPPDAAPAEPGELFESLAVALACHQDDLHIAVRILSDQRLVNCEEQDGEQRVSITTAGIGAVQSWLEQTVPLFGTWPPDDPAADDATG